MEDNIIIYQEKVGYVVINYIKNIVKVIVSFLKSLILIKDFGQFLSLCKKK